MRILIVDDSAYARRRIAQALTGAGHTTLEADSGSAALEQYAATQPDLVTVDLLMPGMPGLELVSHLRALDPHLPIIVHSADVQQTTREQALQAGASWFSSKTDPASELLRVIDQLTSSAKPVALSALQHDAFTEMMNIAMGQAAQALAGLLSRHVVLQVARVEVIGVAGLRSFLDREMQRVGALVRQSFSGPLDGLAALLLPYHHAVILVRDLLGTSRELNQLSPAEQSVLTEVGNIVLNACVARLGDQIQERLQIGLPQLALNQSSSSVADLLYQAVPETSQAIVFLSRLTIGELDLVTYIILMMARPAVQGLLDSLAETDEPS